MIRRLRLGVTYLLLFGFFTRTLVNLGKLCEFDPFILLTKGMIKWDGEESLTRSARRRSKLNWPTKGSVHCFSSVQHSEQHCFPWWYHLLLHPCEPKTSTVRDYPWIWPKKLLSGGSKRSHSWCHSTMSCFPSNLSYIIIKQKFQLLYPLTWSVPY